MTKDTFSRIDAFALTGRSDIIYPYTQGVALGYVLMGFQPVLLIFQNNYLQQIKTVSKIIIFNKTKWIQNNYR